VVPSPSPGNAYEYLFGVSCVSATSCVAVGSSDGSALIETWDGASWSVTPNELGADYSELLGVSCVSAEHCVAVGDQRSGSYTETLIESWDGSSWSVVPSPDPGLVTNSLDSVSCSSATRCVAVGRFGYGGSWSATLIAMWDGAIWSVARNLKTYTHGAALTAVSCPNAERCVAVGNRSVGDSSSKTLVERWDGQAWSVLPSPNVGPGGNGLAGVTCPTDDRCVAVGAFAAGSSTLPLIEALHGSSWSVTPRADVGSGPARLQGVACTSASRCTAVGSHWRGHQQRTLVLSRP
jgi:hypothetical protein